MTSMLPVAERYCKIGAKNSCCSVTHVRLVIKNVNDEEGKEGHQAVVHVVEIGLFFLTVLTHLFFHQPVLLLLLLYVSFGH